MLSGRTLAVVRFAPFSRSCTGSAAADTSVFLNKRSKMPAAVEENPHVANSKLGPIAAPSLPPRTRGAGRFDEYAWMKKASYSKNGQLTIKGILAGERAHVARSLGNTTDFQAKLRNELLAWGSAAPPQPHADKQVSI